VVSNIITVPLGRGVVVLLVKVTTAGIALEIVTVVGNNTVGAVVAFQ
jgi:hypothetical protein